MNIKKQTDYHFIDSPEALEETVSLFEKETILAVDLEADSMFHFREKVCLIQMASPNHTVVIDPLVIEDLSSLKPIFANPSIRKIFHGSDYDVRSLHRDHDIEINNLFDTELASRFVGVAATGLGSVLKDRFGVHLDKSFQKKDWSKRPLPEKMIAYGVDDVVYLLALTEILDKELQAKKRMDWVTEECTLLSRVRIQENGGLPLFKKLRGAGRLSQRELAVLESLLELRLEIAEKKDRPLFKVLGNSALLSLAKKHPKSRETLIRSGILSTHQVEVFGDRILEAIIHALQIPNSELPVYPRTKKTLVKKEVTERALKIKEWRDNLASKLALPPPLLLNKAMLTAIAIETPKCIDDLDNIPDLRTWQKKEFGPQLIQLLA